MKPCASLRYTKVLLAKLKTDVMCNGAWLTASIYFACSDVNIDKVAMLHPFFSVFGCSKKLLMSTVYCLFWVVVNAGQLMR